MYNGTLELFDALKVCHVRVRLVAGAERPCRTLQPEAVRLQEYRAATCYRLRF